MRTVHQHLFKKIGYSDALAKKYIIPGSKSTVGEKRETEFVEGTGSTVEMLEEHAEDIPPNMLAV